MKNMKKSIIPFLCNCLLLLLVSIRCTQRHHAGQLSKETINKLKSSVVEIVVPKNEKKSITYEKELPWETLSFKDRTDKFHSIGTAFFVSDKELVTAAHVLGIPYFTFFKDFYVRNSVGETFKINEILKFSMHQDIATFTLATYPKKVEFLDLNLSSAIGDVVFTVGNTHGEGLSFRNGQVASFTPEMVNGEWNDIRYSSAASPGNSGGPLVNSDGEVLGVIIKKTNGENYNFATPIELYTKMSEEKADCLHRNATIAIFHKENSISKDLKSEHPLPSSISKLREVASMAFDNEMDKLFNDAIEKYKEHYYPNGKTFKTYLREQWYTRGFGGLQTDAKFQEWTINTTSTEDIKISENQKGSFGKNLSGSIFMIIEKDPGTPLKAFLENQKLFLDTTFKSLPFARNFENQNIRITSLGDPQESKKWVDQLGRPWISSLWDLPWTDEFIHTTCLPYPKGAICNIVLGQAASLKLGFEKILQANYAEVTVGYEGELEDWKEYFELPKEYLPPVFRNVKVSNVNSDFNLSSDEFNIKFHSNEISEKSNLHFHLGYDPHSSELREKLLLFEIFPIKGDEQNHFRVQSLYSATKENSDKYQKAWREITTKTGIYSDKLHQVDGAWSLRKVAKSTGRAVSSIGGTTDIKVEVILGCSFDATVEVKVASKKCEQFKQSVKIH